MALLPRRNFKISLTNALFGLKICLNSIPYIEARKIVQRKQGAIVLPNVKTKNTGEKNQILSSGHQNNSDGIKHKSLYQHPQHQL